MGRFGLKTVVSKNAIQDPDDISFSQSKRRPSQKPRAKCWINDLGDRSSSSNNISSQKVNEQSRQRESQNPRKRKATLVPARLKKKQCRPIEEQITQFEDSSTPTQVGPVVPLQPVSGYQNVGTGPIPRFGKTSKRPVKFSNSSSSSSSRSSAPSPLTESKPRSGLSTLHPKQSNIMEKFVDTKKKLAEERIKSRNSSRKFLQMKIEAKKWRAKYVRQSKRNLRLQEKRAQSSSAKANQFSFNKVCRELQNVTKEKEEFQLQVNSLQDELEDMRKDHSWRSKEMMGKDQTIKELQSKLNQQRSVGSKNSAVLWTPARSSRRVNRMSIRRAQQSAHRKMVFQSIMKDAPPEHVKQVQVNQGKRRKIMRAEGPPPRGSILKEEIADELEDKLHDLMLQLWSRPQYKAMTDSLRAAFSSLKLNLNPQCLLVFLDGLVWYPGIDLACAEAAIILLRKLLEGDTTGTTAFAIFGYVPPTSSSRDGIPSSLRDAFRLQTKQLKAELLEEEPDPLVSPKNNPQREAGSTSPINRDEGKKSSTCLIFIRLLELFKWVTPSKMHNLTRSFPKPPKKLVPIPKDYDDRQDLVKALAGKKRKLRHHVLKILLSCLRQTLPQKHDYQISLVLEAQDSFLTMFDHEDVTNEPRDELLQDQTIALRIFVKMMFTPRSLKQFLQKVVELPLRRKVKARNTNRVHSSYAHRDCEGNATKTEGCTLIERIYDIFFHPHKDLNPSEVVLFRLAAVDLMLYSKQLNSIEVLLKRRNPSSEQHDFDDYIPFVTDLFKFFLKLFNSLHKERIAGKLVYNGDNRKLCTALFEIIVSIAPWLQPGKLRNHSVDLSAMLTRLSLWNQSGKGWQMPESFNNDADSLQALINQVLTVE